MNVNHVPTTAEMKAALKTLDTPSTKKPATGAGLAVAVADTIAISAANTVDAVANAGANTVSFLDRVRTGYKFKRALQTGKLVLEEPKTKPSARAKAK